MAKLFKLAFRESRNARGRLVFCLFSIAMGVAALAAVHTIIFNFEESIAKEARNLMGADMTLRSRQPFPKDQSQKDLLKDLRHDLEEKALSKNLNYANLIQFYSMLYQKGKARAAPWPAYWLSKKISPFTAK